VLARYPPHRLLAYRRLFARSTRGLQPAIDFFLGLNLTLPPRAAREEGTLSRPLLASAWGSPHVEFRGVGLASSLSTSSVRLSDQHFTRYCLLGAARHLSNSAAISTANIRLSRLPGFSGFKFPFLISSNTRQRPIPRTRAVSVTV